MALLTLALLGAPAPARADDPRPARPGPLVTDHHGVAVADPYRALEDMAAAETRAWAEAQAAHTRARLDALPGRRALAERIAALDREQTAQLVGLRRTAAGAWIYLKRPAGASLPRLYRRDRAGAPERLLLDPEAWSKERGVPHAINNFSVSPDGRLVAAVVAKADAELGDLQLFDARSGRPVGPPEPAVWGELPAAWSRDSRTFYFTRGADALKPGARPFGKMVIQARAVEGGPPRPALGWQVEGGPLARENDWPVLDASSSERFLAAFAQEGVAGDTRAAFARRPVPGSWPAAAAWRSLFDEKVGVRDAALWGHWVYARSWQGAPRYRLLRWDLRRPEAPPVEVVPQRPGVIEAMGAAADGLYFLERRGALSTLHRLPHGSASGARPVALPHEGAIGRLETDAAVAGAVVTLEGWTRELQVLEVRGDRARPTDLVPSSGSRVGTDWESREETCTGHDGIEVPMSIVHLRGLVKDGSHPTLLDGYGGYGYAEPAFFYRKLDAFLQRGGVFVEASPRGGGAWGREWYQAGVGPRKANTWKDMISCAEALVQRGYTSAGRLVIQGTSMGGVAVGRSITERPELFAGALVRVGILDAVRFIEATDNGPNHELEMGDLKSADGVRQLLAMSTYHQIRDGASYPAVLFTTGLNDNRVAPWITFKTFARMAAATGSGRPVLLRVEGAGGHGVSTTAEQRNAELADRLAFVLWVTGAADFQPPPP